MESKLTDWIVLVIVVGALTLCAFGLIPPTVYYYFMIFCAGYIFRDNIKR